MLVFRIFLFALAGLAAWSQAVGAPPADEPPVDFRRDIEPLLRARCFECHGPTDREGGLALTSRRAALVPTDSGHTAIVPGQPDKSEIIRRVISTDDEEQMPPEGTRLTLKETQLLKRWIEQGARWPDAAAQPKHWAYVKPVRPPRPGVNNNAWPRNEVDTFILSRLETEQLAPAEEAERSVLIRRAYLDLIGLPPSVEEVDAFLNDRSPDAFEAVVDRLLASQHYGEKWARGWLDLARYADSNGFQADQLRDAWAYRDWVIRALNADMPFDQFTIEQVAGDLLPGATIDQRIATGFHRTPTCNVEAGVDPEANRVNQVFDRVNTTGTVWLGETLECAQCHNHKYDPFSQRDYYSLFSYFNNTPLEVKSEDDKGVSFNFYGPKMELLSPPEQSALLASLTKRRSAVGSEMKSKLADALASLESTDSAPDEIAAILAKPAKQRAKSQKDKLRSHAIEQHPEIKQLQSRKADLDELIAKCQPATTLVMVEMDEPRQNHIFIRGEFRNKGADVEPGVPEALHALGDNAPKNRLGLAKWLVDPENPLVARVTVNRWWAEIFGRGLVRTAENFGLTGEKPSHPELLDWLAVEFVSSGWSMKHIHRLIVTSAMYRQSARAEASVRERDPENVFYARSPRLRLPAEAIRDCALVTSGLLSKQMCGPPVYPPQPDGIWHHAGRNAPTYRTADDNNRFRRGVYVVWRRAAPYPSFVNFDAPDRTTCMVQRSRTNTPLQALTLMNDEANIEMAVSLAERVLKECPGQELESRVVYAFRLCVARLPQSAEVEHLINVYRQAHERFRDDEKAARSLVGKHGGASGRTSADDVSEWAAWFYVSNVLLNLDEMITRG